MTRILLLMAWSMAFLGCAHNQSQNDAPVKQSWVLNYLKGYDELYNTFQLPEGFEWIEEQTISDNRLSALYFPKKNLVQGLHFSGCNGASNMGLKDDMNNWHMTVTQVGCTRLVKLPDGSIQEHMHSSRDIADRVFSKIASNISRQAVDWDAGSLTWHSADDELLAKFKLEAAE